jgi:AbiV family abortive infection protein
MPARWKDKLVPRKMLQEGIDKCKNNVNDFLSDAELIMPSGRLNHAYVMVEFAIEEFGKIMLIREAFTKDSNDPFKIDGQVFGTHKGKSEKAWIVLNKKYKLLFDEGVCFPNTLFERGCVVENTEANHDTRCKCAFVDFCSEQWLLGCEIKEEYLKNLIAEIRDKLVEL